MGTGKQEDHKSLYELEIHAMNTTFFVSITNSEVTNWKEHILGWFKYVELEWSRFRGDNELAKLNSTPIGCTFQLSPPLFDLLQKADDYCRKTNGLFSPYLLNQLKQNGYDQSFPFKTAQIKKHIPTQQYGGTPSPFTFNQSELTVTRIAGGKVDLGGIGKGYAVESAATWLKQFAGATNGIVDGGGDISVWSNGEKEWKIGIADPFDQEKELKQISLKNGSIATSNIVYRSWWQGNQKKHHILNGRTGLPVETELLQATVVTTNCLDAEVSAKLCFMETGLKLTKLLTEINLHYKAVLVDCNKNIMIK